MNRVPFHEAVVQEVNKAESADAVLTLAKLTTASIVPKNHDEIMAAFTSAAKRFVGDVVPVWLEELKTSLQEQKT